MTVSYSPPVTSQLNRLYLGFYNPPVTSLPSGFKAFSPSQNPLLPRLVLPSAAILHRAQLDMSDSHPMPWSDNPNAPKISYPLYFREKSSFAGSLIGTILYGTSKTPPIHLSFLSLSCWLF